MPVGLRRRDGSWHCELALSVGTMPLWPPRRWLGRCASSPGGCGLARGSCWSHQSRCLTHCKDPPGRPPRHPNFCSVFKRFLLAPLPLHPPRSILQPWPRTRCWWGSTAQALQTQQVSPEASPRAPRVCCHAEAPSHPLPGRTWHLPGDAAITDTHGDLWAKVPYNTEKPTKKPPTLMQKKEKENVLFMYLFIWFVWDRFF